jgi:hypothetical protein
VEKTAASTKSAVKHEAGAAAMTIQFVSVVQILRIFATPSRVRIGSLNSQKPLGDRSDLFPNDMALTVSLGRTIATPHTRAVRRGPAVSIRECLRMYAHRLIERDVQPNLLS